MRHGPTRTARTTPGTRRAAVVAACLPLLVAATGCGTADDGTRTTGGDRATDPAGASSPAAVPPSSTDDPTGAASPSEGSGGSGGPGGSDGSGGEATVAVYLAGATPQGMRLYREFRRVTGDPLAGAVGLLTTGDVLDPDYRSLFPRGSFASVTHDEQAGRVTAALPDAAWTTAPAGMDRDEARLAVQQLVLTAQAAVQERVPVVVTLGGEPTTLFGVPTAEGLSHGDPLQVLSHVSVTAPEQGSVVEGSFRAEGVASAFEATVPWELRRGDEVVLDGFATAEGWMDRLYPWRSDVIDVSGLEPGTYTFVATSGDASGDEGPGPMVDTKEVRVR